MIDFINTNGNNIVLIGGMIAAVACVLGTLAPRGEKPKVNHGRNRHGYAQEDFDEWFYDREARS